MTLPALTLAVGFVGAYSRYLRSSLLVSLQQPYAWVARGKGLSEREVVRRHALRNALVPFTAVIASGLWRGRRRVDRRRLRLQSRRTGLADHSTG